MKIADDENSPSKLEKETDNSDVVSEASHKITELAKPNKKIQILDDIVT